MEAKSLNKLVVSVCGPFTDIDGLACAVAYAELLGFEGKRAEVALPGSLNETITKTVRGWGLEYSSEIDEDADVVVVDISAPEIISKFAKPERIVELYDHHDGHERYWRELLGGASKIEHIGACATLIWEEFKKRGWADRISEKSADLLMTAIISNTLNFNSDNTTDRDHLAYEELRGKSKLPPNWVESYYEEQEAGVFQNMAMAVKNDTKVQIVPNLGLTLVIAQLELWQAGRIREHLPVVEAVLESFDNPLWFLTAPSISEGKNYIFTKNDEIKDLLSAEIGVKFEGDVGVTDRLWLRKEILKRLLGR